MAEKIATREAYGNALAEFGDKYDFVVLDADLAAATKTGIFKKKFPDRFFDCGIAEGNMHSVAAGIASTGKVVFVSTFAMFSAGRAFEQIRNSIGYPHLNVKIGATHAGITVGEDGATHQCLEDLATMRSIPGMAVVNPADAVEARAAVEWAINYNGPAYLRFGRMATPVIFDSATYKFEFGKAVTVAEGSDVTIIATGVMVAMALEARGCSKTRASRPALSTCTIKPIDRRLWSAPPPGPVRLSPPKSKYYRRTRLGGCRGGLRDATGSGTPGEVNDKFGKSESTGTACIRLTPANIAAKARAAVEMKNKDATRG